MNASFRGLHLTLGSLALIALAAGCAKGKGRPAEPVGRTPTFESQVPAEPGAPGPMGTMPQRPGEPPRGGPGATPSPGEGQAPEQEGAISESDLCDELAQRASLSASEIPGGVQITITPRSPSDAAKIRELARRIDVHMTALEQPGKQPHHDTASRCPLFDTIRTGASGRVVEGPGGLSIVLVSEDTAGVATVRQQAQRFVQSAGEGKVR